MPQGTCCGARGNKPLIFARTSLAPSRSWMLALWTTTNSSKPSVSTRMWRLRPLTFLPASYPRSPPCAVVLTVWESMIAADGVLARPSVWRTCSRHVVLIWVNKAVSRHWQKETYTVCHARKLCGNSRHAHPARSKERIALRISRQSTPHRMQRGSWFLPVICSISQFFLKCLQVSGSCAVAVARLLTPDTIRQIVQSGLRVALLLTPAGRLRDRVQ